MSDLALWDWDLVKIRNPSGSPPTSSQFARRVLRGWESQLPIFTGAHKPTQKLPTDLMHRTPRA
jgi:hypothetical protein